MVSLLLNTGMKKLLLVFAVLLVIAVVGVVTADQLILRNPQIMPNVQIASVDVGGLSKYEAEQKIREATLAVSSTPIIMTDKINSWSIKPADIDFSIDVRGSVAAAYSVGREADFISRWQQRLRTKNQVYNLPATIEFSRSKLAQSLSVLAKQTDREAKDALLSVAENTKSVSVSPAVEGRKLDVDQTATLAFQTPTTNLAFVIDMVFDKQLPKVPNEHFTHINTLLASYSTHFKAWDGERNENLRLAATRIHGTVLKPGEIFSYNQAVGHRTQQEGFRMAPVILDGKLVPDWGGGVCQVSSTLYNAVLLADLDIVERSNHGRAIGYVPLGFDATVVDDQIDFKFKNNLAHPIVLYSTITDTELVFSILGDAKDAPPPIELDYVVHKVIEPIEIKQPDATLEVGKEEVDESPQRGFRVSTYRIRTINGKQVSQLLATDDYDPVNRIVKVGTKPTSPNVATGNSPAKAPDKTPPVSGTITLPGQKPLESAPPVKQNGTRRR
jgi:vancomycin resistance protein YoaR